MNKILVFTTVAAIALVGFSTKSIAGTETPKIQSIVDTIHLQQAQTRSKIKAQLAKIKTLNDKTHPGKIRSLKALAQVEYIDMRQTATRAMVQAKLWQVANSGGMYRSLKAMVDMEHMNSHASR